MKSVTQLAVNGAAGRMGRQLLAAIGERDDLALSAAVESPGHECIGLDVSVLAGGNSVGVSVSNNLHSLVSNCDVVIDFTTPSVSLAVLEAAVSAERRVVVGTTGFDVEQLDQLHDAARHIPLVFAPNYSLGVTVALDLIARTATALGDAYDVEIIEAHHRYKVDAPSGTALRMGEVVADALNRDLSSCAVYGRQGITGERDSKTIGFETIRGGDIIGEHTVMFAGNGERIELTHRATDRMTFARGAVHAARWLASQEPGLYDMTHVMGLSGAR